MMAAPEMDAHRSCLQIVTLTTSHPGPCIERARVTFLLIQSCPLDIPSQLTRVPLVPFCHQTFTS